jgi:protein TIF31
VNVDQVNTSSSVNDLKSLLVEYPSLCHFTEYQLEAMPASWGAHGKKKKKGRSKNKNVSGTREGKGTLLHAFSTVGELEEKQVLRMLPKLYTAMSGRQHVRQLRKILATPVYNSRTVVAAEFSKGAKGSSKKKSAMKKQPAGPATDSTPEEKASESAKEDDGTLDEKREATRKVLLELHKKVAAVKVPVPRSLAAFNKDIEQDLGGSSVNKKVIKSLHSFTFSAFNPPPSNRRMMGDFFYLEVLTLEGQTHHITCTANGFFVNSSKNKKFSPSPRHKNNAHIDGMAHELVDLLVELSPSFKRCYSQLCSALDSMVMETLSGDPWFSLYSEAESSRHLSWNVIASGADGADGVHEQDRNRAEDHMFDMYGVDERGAMRDWNEEYQQCKDMPRGTIPERLNRARALCKVEQEFTSASKKGAEAILSGFVLPINPMDPPNSYVYVFNNIFFSLSVPGGGRDSAGDADGASGDSILSLKHDLHGVLGLNNADVPGLHTLATVVIDHIGQRIVAQSIIPGILQGEKSTLLVYGSVDQGKTIASDPKMHDMVKQAAAKLFIAERTVVPLANEADEEEGKGAADPADGQERGNEDFVVVEKEDASNGTVLMKGAGKAPVNLCGPVDCKGIYGSDGRYYMLDLVRITPKDANFDKKARSAIEKSEDPMKLLEDEEGFLLADTSGPGEDGAQKKMYLLRPELVQIYNMRREEQAKSQALKRYMEEQKKDEKQGAAGEKSGAGELTDGEKPTQSAELPKKPIKVYLSPLRLNINTYGSNTYNEEYRQVVADEQKGDGKTDDAPVKAPSEEKTKLVVASAAETLQKDEKNAYDLAIFLRRVVLPKFIIALRRKSVQPADGAALCSEMHARGINLRYIGYIAAALRLADKRARGKAAEEQKTPILVPTALYTVLEIEMIARATRHIVGAYFRDSEMFRAVPAPLLANFLNLLLGSVVSDSSEQGKQPEGAKRSPGDYHGVDTPASVAVSRMTESVLPKTASDLWATIKADISQRYTGYNLAGFGGGIGRIVKIALLRRVCQKVGIRVVSRDFDFSSKEPISAGDILDVVPVVKHGFPRSPLPEIKKLLELSKQHLARLQTRTAVDLLQEALMFLYQTVGVVHEDAGSCCQMIASALFQEKDFEQAILYQKRAINVYERLYGRDCAACLQGYIFLATMLQQMQQHDLAIQYMGHVIFYRNIMCGTGMSTCTSSYMKLGSLYQEAQHFETARQCYYEALKMSAENPLDTAASLHHLAVVSTTIAQFKNALEYEQKAYKIFKNVLGPDAEQTTQCKAWVKQMTKNVVVRAKQIQNREEEAKREKALKSLMEDEPSKVESGKVSKSKKKSKKNNSKGKRKN